MMQLMYAMSSIFWIFFLHFIIVSGKVDERVVENKNEPVDDILPFDYTKIDLSNLKLDSSRSSAKNITAVNNPHNGQIVNQHHDEIFSCDHVDRLSLSASKLGFDGKTKQEESKDVSSHDIDTEASEDTIADASKVVDLPFLLCNRVSVYPRKPDVVLPVGATLIPFNDSAWVAVSLDFSEHEDNLPNILWVMWEVDLSSISYYTLFCPAGSRRKWHLDSGALLKFKVIRYGICATEIYVLL